MNTKEKKLKIACLQENLKNGVIISERITGKNSSLPILNNILLETNKGFLKISSTDLEMGVEVLVPCKIESSGSVVVPAKLLLSFINNLANTKIIIEESDNKLKISTEDLETIIPLVSKDDFPIIPKMKSGSHVTLNSNILKKALDSVLNSVSNSDVKPEISGILFKFKKDVLDIVATDGFRLSRKSIKNENIYNTDDVSSFILPQKTAIELSKMLNSDNSVDLSIENGQVSFLLDKIKLISRVIEGDYPDYDRIIPKENKISLELDRDELISKLKLAGLFSPNTNDVKFIINSDNNEFIIESEDNIKGRFKSSISNVDVKGGSISIVFNWRFILDGLDNISDKDIVFSFNEDMSPVMIKAKKTDDYIYINMPLKQ